MHGGGQERDIRSGTLNAAGISAFVAAAQSAVRDLEANHKRVSELRRKLISAVQEQIPDATINGVLKANLAWYANITFPNTESDSLLVLFDAEGIACSTGSACSAGFKKRAMSASTRKTESEARSSLRFSLGCQYRERYRISSHLYQAGY